MNTRVYSIFPACGKTWLYEHQEEYDLKILDSDSSYFAWVWECPEDDERGMHSPNARKTNQRNPSFPQNYIDHIKCKIESGKYDCIFVSSHKSVREALDAEGIDFTIVYPASSCKAEWVGRCFIREQMGENGCGAKVMYDNFDEWTAECFECGINHKEITLQSKEYLSHYFEKHHGLIVDDLIDDFCMANNIYRQVFKIDKVDLKNIHKIDYDRIDQAIKKIKKYIKTND